MTTELKLVAFDLDGVLYRGGQVLPGVPEALDYLQERGLQIRFVTNNSTMHRSSVAKKLQDLGLPAHSDQVVGSAYATARYLAGRLPPYSSVLYLGEEGLGRELCEAGFEAVHVPVTREEMHAYEAQAEATPGSQDAAVLRSPKAVVSSPAAVVVGLDRFFTYWGVAAAQHAVLSGALFVATNTDVTIPMENRLFPGGGSMVAAVAACTSREPFVVGKPGLAMAEVLAAASGVDPGQTLFVGDRLDTDIAFGLAAGMVTALVLTGVATRDDLEGSSAVPHYVLENLHDLPGIV